MELTERVRAGDLSAFETLYRKHERRARNYAYILCASVDDAEDVAATAFESILRLMLSGDGPDDTAFPKYLTASVKYEVIATARRARQRDELLASLASAERQALMAEELSYAPLHAAVHIAMGNIRPRWRDVLYLAASDRSTPEICSALSLSSANSYYALLRRARCGARESVERELVKLTGSEQIRHLLPVEFYRTIWKKRTERKVS